MILTDTDLCWLKQTDTPNFVSPDLVFFTALKCVDICWITFTFTISTPRSDVSANYFWITDTMAKVLWFFLYRTYMLNFFKLFLSCCFMTCDMDNNWSSYRHLLYAYKLTMCSFVCMGTCEAGPSSLL
jgi:hypothetical protein